MAIAKVVEVTSSSQKSFEDAIQTGISKVTETVKNVQGAWINEQKVIIQDNKITEYRVNLKISFLVDYMDQSDHKKSPNSGIFYAQSSQSRSKK